MFDLPEHYPIGLTRDNQGPAYGKELDHMGCWCGDPECKKWAERNGW